MNLIVIWVLWLSDRRYCEMALRPRRQESTLFMEFPLLNLKGRAERSSLDRGVEMREEEAGS